MGLFMPIITISMDEEAYEIVRLMEKRQKSRCISLAIKLWWKHTQLGSYEKALEEVKE